MRWSESMSILQEAITLIQGEVKIGHAYKRPYHWYEVKVRQAYKDIPLIRGEVKVGQAKSIQERWILQAAPTDIIFLKLYGNNNNIQYINNISIYSIYN